MTPLEDIILNETHQAWKDTDRIHLYVESEKHRTDKRGA